jgi:hypothetical protein
MTPGRELPPGATLEGQELPPGATLEGQELPPGAVLDDPRNVYLYTERGIPVYGRPPDVPPAPIPQNLRGSQDPGFWSGVGTAFKNTFTGMRDLGAEMNRAADSPAATIVGPGAAIAGDLLWNIIRGSAAQTEAQWTQAGKEFHQGSYIEGVRHALAGAIPFVGPQYLGQMGDVMQTQPRAAVGQTVTEGVLGALPGSPVVGTVARRVGPVTARVGPIFKNVLNPVEQATAQVAAQEGIDLPMSLQTGSKVARNIEGMVQNQPGGATYAAEQRARTIQQTQQAMERKLGQVYPQSVTPEQAGQGTINKLTGDIRKLDLQADQEYTRAWQAEKDPMNQRVVPLEKKDAGGRWVTQKDAGGNVVTTDMPLPIDMRNLKTELEPIADRYEYTLTPTERRDSPGLTAMRNIISGPDYKPISAAELDLSMLKDAARTEKGLRELRTTSQGMAAFTVGKLQDDIDRTLAAADPGAAAALQRGRAATAQKYDIADTLGSFGKNVEKLEPVGVFDRMTWEKDKNIRLLRDLQQKAPAQMPQAGRAWFQDLFDTIGREGDLTKVQAALNKWDALGDEGKKILFRDPQMISDADKLMLLMKRIKLEPNPSGSGYMLAMSNLKRDVMRGFGAAAGLFLGSAGGTPGATMGGLAGAGTGQLLDIMSNAALARAMYKPAFVRALTRTLQAQISGQAPTAALGLSQLLRSAGQETQAGKQNGQQR